MALTFEKCSFGNDGEESPSIQSLCDFGDDFQSTNDTDSVPTPTKQLRVYLRVRPGVRSPRYVIGDCNLKITMGNGKMDCFNFERIFQGSNQFEIFENCAIPLIREFILGSNSLMMTYGVTSSGKTFTMKGDSNYPGIVPHSLISLFAALEHRVQDMTKKLPRYKPMGFCNRIRLSEVEKQNEDEVRRFVLDQTLRDYRSQAEAFQDNEERLSSTHQSVFEQLAGLFPTTSELEVSVWVSYVEIYNDVLIDLLSMKAVGQQQSREKLFLVQEGQNYYIKGSRKVLVTSATEAFLVYLYGQHNLRQHISRTILNEESSRSHSIFRITLVQVDETAQQSLTSHIDFCDLAGAERIVKTGNVGPRVAETKKINQSLSVLNFCIKTLKDRQLPVVPFRNSKLTHVLQPYLCSNGGSMAMIININPSAQLFDESVFSLSLCDAIKAVPTGTLQRAVRRLTIFPGNFAPCDTVQEEIIEETESSELTNSDWDVSVSMIANYEKKIQEFEYREQQFLKLINDLKALQKKSDEFHRQNMEDERASWMRKIEFHKGEFREEMVKMEKKYEQLETKLFETEADYIAKCEALKAERDEARLKIEDQEKLIEDKNKLIESYLIALNLCKERLDVVEAELHETSLRSKLQEHVLPPGIMNSLSKQRPKSTKKYQSTGEVDQAPRVLRQIQSAKKLKLKFNSCDDLLSPDTVFSEIKSEQKAATDVNEPTQKRLLRSRRNLRF